MGETMADVEKKMAAALAAVNTYMQQEEEAIYQHTASTTVAQSPPPDLNLWGLSGRQDMMSMRQLIQMKAFSRF